MGFDDSPPQPVPLLELPLSRPVTPDPTSSTSDHPTQDGMYATPIIYMNKKHSYPIAVSAIQA